MLEPVSYIVARVLIELCDESVTYQWQLVTRDTRCVTDVWQRWAAGGCAVCCWPLVHVNTNNEEDVPWLPALAWPPAQHGQYNFTNVVLSHCHSRQTKQNTGHTQGSMNARVRCTPTTNTCFLFCIFQHLNQSGKKCKRIQHREERLIIDWWNHIILEYLRERSPLLFYLIRNYLFKNCWHFTKFVYPDDMISTFIKAK